MQLSFIQFDNDAGYYTNPVMFNPIVDLMGYVYPTQNGNQSEPGIGSFEKFRVLFDQFKINAMRIKIQIVSQPTPQVNAAVVVRSAIDRNGVSPDLANKYNNTIEAMTSGDSATKKSTIAAFNRIFETYSSFNTKIININDLYSLYRTFYPVGRERGQWYGASHQFKTNADKDDLNLADFMYPFKPQLMLQFFTNNLSQSSSVETFTVTIDD